MHTQLSRGAQAAREAARVAREAQAAREARKAAREAQGLLSRRLRTMYNEISRMQET